MNWTNELPKKNGYYWVNNDAWLINIADVTIRDNYVVMLFCGNEVEEAINIDKYQGDWLFAGPIRKPIRRKQ